MTKGTIAYEQDTGFVPGLGSTSLQEANQCIANARNETPPEEHYYFTSYIKKYYDGYEWGWVFK